MSTTDPQAGVPPVVHRLDYGRQPSRLSRWWRRLRGPILFLITAGICYACRGPIVLRTKQLYWQRQCMNYVNCDDVMMRPTEEEWTIPPAWKWFLRYSGIIDAARCDPWLVFLGSLSRPDGQERLVRLVREEHSPTSDPSMPPDAQAEWRICALVVRPAGFFEGPLRVDPGVNRGVEFLRTPDTLNEVYFSGAVRDPADASHLTIRAEWDDGLVRTIDVNLGNNDDVKFTWRTPP